MGPLVAFATDWRNYLVALVTPPGDQPIHFIHSPRPRTDGTARPGNGDCAQD